MDSAIPIQHVDLRPTSRAGPYLRDGSVVTAANPPLPLETVLVNFMRLADSVDTADLVTIADELAAGLDGAAGLRAIVGFVVAVASRDGTRGDRRGADGDPGSGSIDRYGPAVGNAVSTSQVMVTRTPALSSLLVALPRGIGQLGSIEHGGVADFDLVAAQGPACYYPNTRRPPTDTTPREPVLDYHCPADMPGLQQRGAANAPRPGVPAAPQVTAYDPATRTTVGPDGVPFTIGTSGGQNAVFGPRSWYALLLQGAS